MEDEVDLERPSCPSSSKIIQYQKLLRQLNEQVGSNFNCKECNCCVAQILADHLKIVHGFPHSFNWSLTDHCKSGKEDENNDGRLDEEPSKMVSNTVSKGWSWAVVDVENDTDEKEKARAFVNKMSEGLPELTLESQLQLQHMDENEECDPVDDEASKYMDNLEEVMVDLDTKFSEPNENDWLEIPETSGVAGGREEQEGEDVSSWADFVKKVTVGLRESTKGGAGNLTIRKRVVKASEKHKCELCARTFFKRSLLFQHSVKHLDGGIRRCEVCNKLTHLPPGQKECGRRGCNTSKKESQVSKWKKDNAVTTPGEKKKRPPVFECEVCSRQFLNLPSALLHGESHSGREIFECQECATVHPSAEGLDEHMVSHVQKSGNSYACQLCTKTFTKRNNFIRHMDIHKGIRYTCKECDRSYTQEYQLKCHMLKHAGVAAFKCNDCGQEFTEPSTFSRHKKKQHRLKLKQEAQDTDNSDVTVEIISAPEPEEGTSHPGILPDLHVTAPRRVPDPCLPPSSRSSPKQRPIAPHPSPPLPPLLLKSAAIPSATISPAPLKPVSATPVAPTPARNGREIILCKSVPSDKGKTTFVVNSITAEPTGVQGFQEYSTSVTVESGRSLRKGLVPAPKPQSRLAADKQGTAGKTDPVQYQAVQVEVDGKLYPAFIM